MSYDFDGSNDYLTASIGAATTTPVTLACWFYNNNNLSTRALVTLSDSTGNNGFRITLSTSRNLNAVTEAGGTSNASTTTATFSNATWNHACGVFNSSTSRIAYLNGVNATTSTTSRTPSGINRTRIGTGGSATDSFMNGLIAEVGIWDKALTAEEIAALADGIACNLISPQNLILYAPLVRNLFDYSKTRLSLTNSGGAVVENHPRVYL